MPLIARYSRIKLAMLVVLGPGLTALCLFIITDAPPASLAFAASCLGVPLFTLATVICVRRMFQRDEVLRIDADGIFMRPLTDRPIPWTAIDAISETRVSGQRFHAITLNRPAADFLQTGYKRLLYRLNRPFGGDLYLSAHSLNIRHTQIRDALAHFAPPGITIR